MSSGCMFVCVHILSGYVSQPAHLLSGTLGLAPGVVNFRTQLANYSAPDVPETQGGRHVSCLSVVYLLHARLGMSSFVQ
jgi:hypothetical protein